MPKSSARRMRKRHRKDGKEEARRVSTRRRLDDDCEKPTTISPPPRSEGSPVSEAGQGSSSPSQSTATTSSTVTSVDDLISSSSEEEEEEDEECGRDPIWREYSDGSETPEDRRRFYRLVFPEDFGYGCPWDRIITPSLQFWDDLDDILDDATLAEIEATPAVFWDGLPEQVWEHIGKRKPPGVSGALAITKVKKIRKSAKVDMRYTLAKQLISLEDADAPIKATHSSEEVKSIVLASFPRTSSMNKKELSSAVGTTLMMLETMEPVFHPLLRKAHTAMLLAIMDIKRKGEQCANIKKRRLRGDQIDDEEYLQDHIDSKLKACQYYLDAKAGRQKLVDLNKYLSSSPLFGYELSNAPLCLDHAMDAVRSKLGFDESLQGLVEKTVKARLQYTKWMRDILVYKRCLRKLVEDLKKKGPKSERMLAFVGLLDESDLDSEWLEDVGKMFFRGLPRNYVVQGLLNFEHICEESDKAAGRKARVAIITHEFGRVADHLKTKWNTIKPLWEDMKFCDDLVHRIHADPLSVLGWNASEKKFERNPEKESRLEFYTWELPSIY